MGETYHFQVHLGGMLDVLSNHLYKSPDVFLRELLQNGVDAITMRQNQTPGWHEGALHITVEPERKLIFRDNGAGLSEEGIHRFLAVIGQSSKTELVHGRLPEDYIGRFGIGLLSCFMVSDTIVIHTRPAEGGPAHIWTGRPDGTYTLEPLEDCPAGTTVILTAKAGMEDYFQPRRVAELARYYGLALLVAGFVLWALTRIPGGLDQASACCGLFVASLLLTIAAMLFTSVGTAPRYLFLYWPLAAAGAAWLMKRGSARTRGLLALTVLLFAVHNFAFSYVPLVRSCFDPKPLPQQQAADWLEEQGCDQIYGQFWTVGPIGLAANGAVDAGHWVFSNFYEISPYLTAEDLYTEQANEAAAYVFTQQDRERGVEAARRLGVELEYQGQVGELYYIYKSPKQLMHHTPDAGRDSGY